MPLFFSSNDLTISGYSDEKFSSKIGDYKLQVGPEAFDISLGDNTADAGRDIDGSKQVPSDPPKILRSLKFTFLIDNTGLLPSLPDGCYETGTDIGQSIEELKKVSVTENNEIHRKPFVEVTWDKLNIRGVCTDIIQEYTFFHEATPLRAKITMNVKEISVGSNPLFRSPDISRIPTVKEGDNLIKFCEEYYGNRELYIKIAELNNLPSFRRLKEGQSLEFPPIKK